ncbi:bifunctional [glutamine synthetase] adenylyltransferase/[glutamine synthetase]-adenylyl-L-tyrosine phosphorylase [Falsirhodobacter xinxiangensis]|uniref:bifunctional [glutamine synthetase] adenylyltransferase/[glutamine synthetase]-adenylyl-L-tyrosine phosphorylase n=1 Tax=Falsirhodobacter xinxiangensis TaxID=2530049 RepID=UPI0010AA2793|nr:bifunctional [glutamine synthetase] adenylyltransferase/[glutamine synthetase]-adenylyl-L-tyrosine phosphorylase [Rhodobacter xinxiangensis]
MTNLASRITRLPIAHDPAQAAEITAQFSDLGAQAARLMGAVSGSSPYLRDLALKERDWLATAFDDPEAALAAELSRDAALAELPSMLRQAKRRVALLAALADLAGVWSLEEVTGALTALADRAVDLSIRRLVEDEVRRGKLPDATNAGGMVAIAMGKMGARELNYSSDIDLICLFDETRYGADWQEARQAFVRVTRKMTAILSDNTAEGYVFRSDLRLRPDASVTPVCISMAAAESYYESVGRTWERAAYIKARPCGGDIAAGERFLSTLTPFVWRKHLDFAAIQDAHDMRLRIREHRGLHGPLVIEGHDMKLGQGGIREIEFFTQTRQLIAGGRDPSLRDRTTVGGLAALARQGWIPAGIAEELTALYRAHREVEHRLQMIADQQTHKMPVSPEAIDRVAHLAGQDPEAFRVDLLARLERTAELTEGFFAPPEVEKAPELTERQSSIVDGWAAYPALRSDRAQAIFRRIRPQLLRRMQEAGHMDEALMSFDGFLRGLPAGVQIFSLFDSNPQLVDLIVDIAAVSPRLSVYLSRNASVLDAVLGGSFFAAWPGAPLLRAELAKRLDAVGDYEGKLDAARRWMKEWHFRIGVHHLRGLTDAFESGKEYADLAEAALCALWPVSVEEFGRKHGPQPGRGAALVAMGSLGAARLTSASDLDLIVIYDADGVEESNGPKPLATRTYFARLTQAFLTAVTAPMSEGRLYEVDMRLRPSGRQGPVATGIAAFRTYQMEEAWTWEHLALTRARPIAGDPSLMAEVEALRRDVLTARGGDARILSDISDMRQKLAAAKPSSGPWDAKNGPGRMMDVELAAQSCALRTGDGARRVEAQLRVGRTAGLLTAEEENILLNAYRLCWRLQAATRLLTERELLSDDLGQGGRAFIQRETSMNGTLADEMAARSGAAAGVIERMLAEGPQPRAPIP